MNNSARCAYKGEKKFMGEEGGLITRDAEVSVICLPVEDCPGVLGIDEPPQAFRA